jgi:asparagine synthase (glutamine-hydrolysing)
MVDTLAHRGPDGSDAWAEPEAGIALGHRRLAIIDLTETGAQPMHSADGRYVIVFNGEVYNFQELRAELENRGHRFHGHSDTEVMLAAFLEWGPERAVERFTGMFAFALFDRQSRSLRLVRDRIGVKPLYWTIAGGTLLFGSELRALMAHPKFRKEVDREAIAAVVRYSYVPGPATVFKNVHKLPAGSILTMRPGAEPAIKPYWRLLDAVDAQRNAPMSFEDATDRLDKILRESVTHRLIADVPIGAFLSGGIDSSSVVAHMQAASSRPVRTFTIGFANAEFDETAYARDVARHLGTDHTEVVLEPDAALDLVRQAADWFDEPFADSSQLPSYLVAKITRRHVTVALSGDGGDEMFGGYPKYAMLARLWRYAGALPQPLRATFGRCVAGMPEPLLRGLAAVMDPARAERLGEKARRLGAALAAKDADHAVLALDEVGLDPHCVTGAAGALKLAPVPELGRTVPDFMSRMQLMDMLTFLPDDIMTKVDRCAMAVSLEAREPLLDHKLIEFVWSLPPAVKRGDGRPKALLRAMLGRYIPRQLIERPKRGFLIPLGEWLSGPLRGWAEELLSPSSLAKDGLFDVDRVRTIWSRHLSGAETNATGLWNILMVRAWSERWLAR